MFKGSSRLRRLYIPRASGVHPLYTTRRADTPPDLEELTRAVLATTTAPHSNRKQRIPPGNSPGVVSGRFLAALESVRRVSRCEAWLFGASSWARRGRRDAVHGAKARGGARYITCSFR